MIRQPRLTEIRRQYVIRKEDDAQALGNIKRMAIVALLKMTSLLYRVLLKV